MLDKSRSKEKGGEPEMFLEVAGILVFGGQTCACVWGKLQKPLLSSSYSVVANGATRKRSI